MRVLIETSAPSRLLIPEPSHASSSSSRLSSKKVVVVGGGVLGIATALGLAAEGAYVTVYAEQTVNTTSAHVSGGLIEPYALADERIGNWFRRTLRALELLAGERLRRWIMRRSGLLFSSEPARVVPAWSEDVHFFEYPVPSPVRAFPHASRYETLTLRSDHLMSTLYGLSRQAGVAFKRRRVHDLATLIDEERPDAVVAAAGLGMADLWPDVRLSAGIGVVRIVELPPAGHLEWLDRGIETLGIDIREVILMNADLIAYSIPRRADRRGWTQLVIGGTNVVQAAAASITLDEAILLEHRRNVTTGLPELFSHIIDRVEGEWRVGGRPLRDNALLEIKMLLGVPVLGLGGVGGSGMSVFVGVAEDGIELLTRHWRSNVPAGRADQRPQQPLVHVL